MVGSEDKRLKQKEPPTGKLSEIEVIAEKDDSPSSENAIDIRWKRREDGTFFERTGGDLSRRAAMEHLPHAAIEVSKDDEGSRSHNTAGLNSRLEPEQLEIYAKLRLARKPFDRLRMSRKISNDHTPGDKCRCRGNLASYLAKLGQEGIPPNRAGIISTKNRK